MIALVFIGDLTCCPYLKRYTERLNRYKINYKVYFWNRAGAKLKLSEEYCCFDRVSKLNKPKLLKFFDFVLFKNWVTKQLHRDNPHRIIFLSTLSGILLFDYVIKTKKDYYFDIRDYSYEHISLFYAVEKYLIKHSVYTSISSKGYEAFLPKHSYIIAHNFNRDDICEREFLSKGEPIRIVWNGVMRYFDNQVRIINALKNDDRFQLVYHGQGPEYEKYVSYCKTHSVKNVLFTGKYNNEQKTVLLAEAGIINNYYEKKEAK